MKFCLIMMLNRVNFTVIKFNQKMLGHVILLDKDLLPPLFFHHLMFVGLSIKRELANSYLFGAA